MDGARLLNACAATGVSPSVYANEVDAVAFCLGKGLSCPFGSLLVGTKAFIEKAKRFRKWFGGGLHQSGVIAAMGLHALRHNLPQIEDDHRRARMLADFLREDGSLSVQYEGTNILMIDVRDFAGEADAFVAEARRRGVLLLAWTPCVVRAVTYHGVSDEGIKRAARVIKSIATNC